MTSQSPHRETTQRIEPAGEGALDIYTISIGGQPVLEAFSLGSLASVLGIAETTLEGRYNRTGLRMLTVAIPSKSGRPMRGFELRRYDEVVGLLTTPKARVAIDANAGTYLPPEMTIQMPLVSTEFEGKHYYTAQAIADHFNLSLSTVRTRLQDSGLAKRADTLPSSSNGGRPRRVYPESMLADIKLAVIDGDKFRNAFDRALVPAGSKAKAQEYVESQIVHQPPVPFDRSSGHLAPVVPIGGRALNAVKSAGGFNTKAMADELVAELETIFATAKPVDVTPVPVRPPASYEGFSMNPEYFEANMATIESAVLDNNSPPDSDSIMGSLRQLNGLCSRQDGGDPRLVMTIEQMDAHRARIMAAWSKLRDREEPRLDAMRELIPRYFKDRADPPTLTELLAANSVFCESRAMKSEREEFRRLIASPFQMYKALSAAVTIDKSTGMAPSIQLFETTRFKVARRQLDTLMLDVDADLTRQKKASGAVMQRFVDGQVATTVQSLDAAAAQLAADGVHAYFIADDLEFAAMMAGVAWCL